MDTGEFPPEGPNQYWDTILWKTSNFLFDRFKPNAGFDVEIAGNSVSMTNQSTTDNLVSWDFGDGTTSLEKQPVHIYSMDGAYKVSLTVCNALMACDSTSETIHTGVTQSAFNIDEENVKIYPNPVLNTLNIAGNIESVDLKVFDLTGRLILQNRNSSEKSIDVSLLKPGIYLLEIKTLKRTISIQFVKG